MKGLVVSLLAGKLVRVWGYYGEADGKNEVILQVILNVLRRFTYSTNNYWPDTQYSTKLFWEFIGRLRIKLLKVSLREQVKQET